jgi:hypothetical protein
MPTAKRAMVWFQCLPGKHKALVQPKKEGILTPLLFLFLS